MEIERRMNKKKEYIGRKEGDREENKERKKQGERQRGYSGDGVDRGEIERRIRRGRK